MVKSEVRTEEDRIVYVVEAIDADAIALLDTNRAEACNKLSDQ